MIKLLSLTLLIPALCCGQSTTQALRGQVVDLSTLRPVGEALIEVGTGGTWTVMTDTSGNYQLQLPPGKYSALVSHPHYRTTIRENIVVLSGKQQVQDFVLRKLEQDMEAVVVRPEDNGREVGLDQWNIQNFAAVFYDPARVVNSHAGAINMDAGTNHLTVRGTSPNYIQWKVEEVEIVNPNHLENAGTLNDRPALNGGGVSMISAQLMQNSAFQFAPFPTLKGNALSGIFDMKLRSGNTIKREYVVQASLLGTDISAEGPFSKNGGASYLFNFRYSTIGLLSLLGVNFGDERTSFTDFSHMVFLPYKKGSVRIFGINGTSQTLFAGKKDSNEVEIQKELQDIDYRSSTFINGLSMVNQLPAKTYLKTVFAYSSKNNDRVAMPLFGDRWQMPAEYDHLYQSKFSSLNYLSGQVRANFDVRAGTYFTYFRTSLRTGNSLQSEVTGSLHEALVQPFISVQGQIAPRLMVLAGMHGYYLPRMGYSQLQPRAELRYNHPTAQQFVLSYGQSAQLQNPSLLLGNQANLFLLPTSNEAFAFAHLIKLWGIDLKHEIYYQLYTHIPVDSTSGFSAFNYFNEQVNAPLQQDGTARVMGYDLRIEQTVKSYYFIFSSSIYRSLYTLEGVESDARFSTGYNLFGTVGREQKLKNKDRSWSVDLRAVQRRGFRENAADATLSRFTFPRRIPDYFRADARISYKKNKASSTVIWALDLQNVSGQKNVAYHYFDRVTGREETRYHLGLIPVLSYKVMF